MITELWYKPGTDLLHREDGPAIEWSGGYKAWYIEGRLHRIDGPAVEWSDGDKTWWINGKYYDTKEEWYDALTPEQKKKAIWNLE